MGGGSREQQSLDRVLDVLRRLRCPNPRLGEGSAEWDATKGAYRFTPDLVAGRLVGAGDPQDFYIDVFRPTGAKYVKPLAGDPQAAAVLAKAIRERGSFDHKDLASNHDAYYKPLSDKLQKYSGSRSMSPMLGLVMYFDVGEGTTSGAEVLAHIDALSALDAAFGFMQNLGDRATEIMRAPFEAGPRLTTFVQPLVQPISFILWCKDRGSRDTNLMMILNQNVTGEGSSWREHSVVKWLRRFSETPDEILQAWLKGDL